MKEYPSISRDIQFGVEAYVFNKIDGSNIRAEWSRKKERIYKYGSRHELISHGHPFLGESLSLIQDNFEEELNRIFLKQRHHKAMAFFEFHGDNSFAGFHQPDEPHRVTLIDVKPYKSGIINPDDFVDLYGHLDHAKLLYRGKINKEFVEQVRRGELPGMSEEGVVCKVKEQKKTKHPTMFKIKTYAWLKKLKTFCKDDEKLYNRLV